MGVDTKTVNKSAGKAGQGKAVPTWAPSVRKEDATAPETYTEIKAPTSVGTRSSVPYTKVLPSYKKKAESALDRQEIPRQHQKRVKEYFESLGK